MERAIKIAIENGYTNENLLIENGVLLSYNPHHFLLDPLFWQALGKGLGWTDDAPHTSDGYPWASTAWETYWHRLIEHLAEGKDIESFFTNLLN